MQVICGIKYIESMAEEQVGIEDFAQGDKVKKGKKKSLHDNIIRKRQLKYLSNSIN